MASEVDQIMEAMASGNHFLLSGGAGSGKTHTLIELIRRINQETPKSKIACITYTNVAADEITERADSISLKASTIHDFLWDNIKGFQANLRQGIIELNESITEDDLLSDSEIQYREFKSLKKGIISHGDVLLLAKYLFEKYALLSKLINDKFDYIFIDEYQDTSNEVIDIIFKSLNRKDFSLKIGFFGDSMQSIYDGVGKIETVELIDKVHHRKLKIVQKKLNRRNPQRTIDLANKLRNDGLYQEPDENISAPNISKDGTVKKGSVKFLYSSSANKNVENVKESKYCSIWDYENYNDKGKPISKILLTKNSAIAYQAKFNSLFDIYTKDKIVGKSGYVKRIKDFLKIVEVDFDVESYSFSDLLDVLIKKTSDDLDFEKAMQLLKSEIEKTDTTRKAINALKKTYPGIDKIIPTGTMCDYIFENDDLFQIALLMDYKDLTSTYLDKEKLIGVKKSKNVDSNKRNDEKDVLIKYLFKIQEVITHYENDDIHNVLKKIDFKILIGKHKSILKEKMDKLKTMTKSKIKDVIEYADNSGLLNIDSRVSEFMKTNSYLIERINRVSFEEITNLYNYTEGLSPYSTQHGIKGEEFNNVLVVVNNDKIPQLKVCYEYLFTGNSEEKKYYDRTLNLFYVSCTRVMENLVVFYEGECSEQVISKANEWFGEDNVIDLA